MGYGVWGRYGIWDQFSCIPRWDFRKCMGYQRVTYGIRGVWVRRESTGLYLSVWTLYEQRTKALFVCIYNRAYLTARNHDHPNPRTTQQRLQYIPGVSRALSCPVTVLPCHLLSSLLFQPEATIAWLEITFFRLYGKRWGVSKGVMGVVSGNPQPNRN